MFLVGLRCIPQANSLKPVLEASCMRLGTCCIMAQIVYIPQANSLKPVKEASCMRLGTCCKWPKFV